MSAVTPNKCSCLVCRKETSQLGIKTHYRRAHGTEDDRAAWQNSILAKTNKKISNHSEYNLEPALCQACSTAMPYDQRHNKFCSHKCGAISSNSTRRDNGWVMPEEAKHKISLKLSKPKYTDSIVGEYSKIFYCSCKHCSTKFIAQTPKRLCYACKVLTQRATDIFSFKFNVYLYPELFNLALIEKHGWFSQGGKRRKTKNINGVSRDHRVSVSEALKNDYDHYYITHPINCELMLHSDNSKKYSKSSITYAELVAQVDEYDKLGGLLR